MKTITLKVFEFKELSKEAQQKALDQHREINVDFADWNDYILSDICAQIKEKTGMEISEKDLMYEMFSRSNSMYIDSKKVISFLCHKYPEINDFDIPTKFGIFLNYLGGGLCSGIKFSEYDTDRITFEEEAEEENEVKEAVRQKTQQQRQEEIKDKVDTDLTAIQNIISKGYTEMYEQYNYATGDEAITETFEANEYTFLENGEMKNY